MSERNDNQGLWEEALETFAKAFEWVIMFPLNLMFKLFFKDKKEENETESNKD
jgi:hypothetical protein